MRLYLRHTQLVLIFSCFPKAKITTKRRSMQTVQHWQIIPYTIGFGCCYHLLRVELFPPAKKKMCCISNP